MYLRKPFPAKLLIGAKASDEFAVPLCRVHHRAVHRAGDERAWWKAAVDRLEVMPAAFHQARSSPAR